MKGEPLEKVSLEMVFQISVNYILIIKIYNWHTGWKWRLTS